MRPIYRNHGCRIAEYSQQGVRVLFLENELLRVGVLVDKGADIFQLLYKPNDTEFMLHTPRGVRPPAVQSISSDWGSFLDYYEGGWQEILPNGGPSCSYKGVEFGLHGEVTTIPWDYQIEIDQPDIVKVSLSVRPFRSPYFLQRRMTLKQNEPILLLKESLTNESREHLQYMWGHHPAFGAPFLNENCRIDLPGEDLIIETIAGAAGTRLKGGGQHHWPLVQEKEGPAIDFSRADAPGIEEEDLGYLVNLPEGWYAITNRETKVGFAMSWSLETFPYLWMWRNFNMTTGHPWYGQVYTMALEPWSSYPSGGLVTAIEKGTAVSIAPGETHTAELRAIAFQGLQKVTHVSPEGIVSGE